MNILRLKCMNEETCDFARFPQLAIDLVEANPDEEYLVKWSSKHKGNCTGPVIVVSDSRTVILSSETGGSKIIQYD